MFGFHTASVCATEDTMTILQSPVAAADSRTIGSSSRVSKKGLKWFTWDIRVVDHRDTSHNGHYSYLVITLIAIWRFTLMKDSNTVYTAHY